MTASQTQVTMFSVASIGLLVWGLMRYLNKPEHKGLDKGMLIMRLFAQETGLILIILNALFIAGESLMAAGATTDDRMNVTARFVTHMALGFLSFIGAINFFKSLRLCIVALQTKEWGAAITQLLLFGIMVIMAMGAPFVNTLLLAHAFHQSVELDLFLTDWFGSNTDYIRKLIEAGKTVPYSPWTNLHTAVAASICLNLFGFVILLYEGLSSVYVLSLDTSMEMHQINFNKGGDKKDEKKDDKKDDKNEEKQSAEDKEKTALVGKLKTLLEFFYDVEAGKDTDKGDVGRHCRTIMEIMKKRSLQELVVTTATTAQLSIAADSAKKANKPKDVYEAKLSIKKFFATGAPKDKTSATGGTGGFGITLPDPKKPGN